MWNSITRAMANLLCIFLRHLEKKQFRCQRCSRSFGSAFRGRVFSPHEQKNRGYVLGDNEGPLLITRMKKPGMGVGIRTKRPPTLPAASSGTRPGRLLKQTGGRDWCAMMFA